MLEGVRGGGVVGMEEAVGVQAEVGSTGAEVRCSIPCSPRSLAKRTAPPRGPSSGRKKAYMAAGAAMVAAAMVEGRAAATKLVANVA